MVHTPRYTCRHCGAESLPTRTPAGEPCYTCSNPRCGSTVMAATAPYSLDPMPQPVEAPALVAATSPADRAAAKARYHLAGGLDIRQWGSAYLVPSGTRGGIVHRVEGGRCSCEAGTAGKPCWHVAAVELVEGCALVAA